ncbi:MAG TPA: MutL protein [Acholeplasmatales bacterium]|nr:MutL protein [Acholeplasmatales bacterium]
MKPYLLVDFGSTYTKLTAVDVDAGTLLGTASHFSTVEEDISIGYHSALKQLSEKFGKYDFFKIIACSSAAGGLKMAAIGLVEELTVEAAKRACFGAGGKVDLVFSHYLTIGEVQKIIDSHIDIVLLAGGTDGGNSDVVIHNAKMLGTGKVTVPIIYAGNKSCQDEISSIFTEYGLNGFICDNIMPRLNVLEIEKAKDIIRQIFLQNIIVAKGIKQIESEIDEVMLPTPFAVLKAAELLSRGYLHENGFGDIVLCDIGGATTDVYSIGNGYPKRADVVLKGLEEPFAKRTVEGDLGMRWSAEGVLQTQSEQDLKLFAEQGMDIHLEAKYRHDHVDMVPKNAKDEAVDRVFAEICNDVAMSRHVGKMEMAYTPMGMMYFQVGKDLSEVNYVIGTGGVVIHDSQPTAILNKLCFNPKKPLELRPKKTKFMLDKQYILSAMGLLSLEYPEIALKIMKKNLELI